MNRTEMDEGAVPDEIRRIRDDVMFMPGVPDMPVAVVVRAGIAPRARGHRGRKGRFQHLDGRAGIGIAAREGPDHVQDRRQDNHGINTQRMLRDGLAHGAAQVVNGAQQQITVPVGEAQGDELGAVVGKIRDHAPRMAGLSLRPG